MNDLAQTVAALAERVAALETENAHLRSLYEPNSAARIADGVRSRRSLLAGGAGLLGAVAAGSVLAPNRVASAQATSTAHVVQARQYTKPYVLATTVTLVPQRGGGHHWARYVWDMGGGFTGSEPPAVIAAASDDYHGSNEWAEPTLAVTVTRGAGNWQAEILVNHVGHLATEVTLHAIAFGTAE